MSNLEQDMTEKLKSVLAILAQRYVAQLATDASFANGTALTKDYVRFVNRELKQNPELYKEVARLMAPYNTPRNDMPEPEATLNANATQRQGREPTPAPWAVRNADFRSAEARRALNNIAQDINNGAPQEQILTQFNRLNPELALKLRARPAPAPKPTKRLDYDAPRPSSSPKPRPGH